MVLNIPFPPTHTLTNKQCTLLCQAQQASCDVVLRASYLPDANNRANKGCRQRVTIGQAAEVTLVQPEIGKRLLLVTAPVIKAFNILKAYFSTCPDLLLWCCDANSTAPQVTHSVSFHCSSVIVYTAVCKFWLLSETPDLCIPGVVGALRYKKVGVLRWAQAKTPIMSPTAEQVTTVHQKAVPDRLPRGCMRDFWQLSHTQKVVISSTEAPMKLQFYCICPKHQPFTAMRTHYTTVYDNKGRCFVQITLNTVWFYLLF